jgi:hypothetical protein
LLAVATVLIATGSVATAHHSTAIYDKSWRSLEGSVVEYKYVNPHTIIVLKARESDGQTTIWRLEGLAPAMLVREQWSRDTLRPGDELKLWIMPLRSGAKGGFWHPRSVNFRNGTQLSNIDCPASPAHCAPW